MSLVPGSFAAQGRTVSQNMTFLNEPLVPGNFAAWGGTFSQKSDFHEFWDSCAQSNTSEIPKMDFQEFWDSCAQNKTSEISTNALSGILGLLCAEQDVGNLKR